MKFMSYCPKCGNKVDETMAFCPRCGASLKVATPDQPTPPPAQTYRRRDEKSEKNEKQEKDQSSQRNEKQEKGEGGFIGYLIGGLILITLGLFSVLQISGYFTVNTGQSWAVMLLIIGIIIIVGAIYVALVARRRSPQPP
jgi:predicted lipid-binding transport protein (Tim44 family)